MPALPLSGGTGLPHCRGGGDTTPVPPPSTRPLQSLTDAAAVPKLRDKVAQLLVWHSADIVQLAYDIDFATHSTNLVARRRSTPLGAASLPWPSLGC